MSFSSDKFSLLEGATPIPDISGLRPMWVQNMEDLNRVEAENIMEAQGKFLRSSVDDPKNWFTTTVLRKIHREMFGNVWDWAGRYRKSQTSVGITPSLIPSQLAIFCGEVQSWSQHGVELTFLEMAARVHHRLVLIHPFENGNGRFSRLVADRVLLSWKCPHPIWPSNLGNKCDERKIYIHALKVADKGDYDPLLNFMKSCGARDPSIGELLSNPWYRETLDNNRLLAATKALLRSGDTANERANGRFPLQLAIERGNIPIVELLLDSGVDVNAPDHSGLTPFQVAILQGNKILADLLVLKGANRHVPQGIENATREIF